MNKKLLTVLIAVVLPVIFSGKVFGQISQDATVSVKLADARSISITNPNVLLNFSSTADYTDGVNYLAKDQLSVTSSTGYQIKVSSVADLASTAGNKLPANTISVQATPATADPNVTLQTQKLGTSGGLTIVSSSKGTLPLSFSINYKTDAGAYINKPADTYNVVVTYSIAPL